MLLDEVSSNKCFEGIQKVYQHQSNTLNCKMKFSIYLPPCYQNQTACTVVFFLQGLTCTEQNFMIKSGAQRVAAQLSLILVSPDTSPRGCNIEGEDDSYDFGSGAGFYLNATQKPWENNYLMYDYITKELPDIIESNFKIVSGKYGLCGHSMGGHGALIIGLKESNRFVSVSAFAPICHPSVVPWGIKAFKGYLGEGADTSIYDACELITKHNKRFALPPLIDQGEADEHMELNLRPQDLVRACTDAKQEIIMRYHEGYDHSYFFISTYIEEHLRFHHKNLST